MQNINHSCEDKERLAMKVSNRVVERDELTFFQWLNIYEFMTKREFKELPSYKQENYRREFEMWQNGLSQYNE